LEVIIIHLLTIVVIAIIGSDFSVDFLLRSVWLVSDPKAKMPHENITVYKSADTSEYQQMI
jgi:hypothetical protein